MDPDLQTAINNWIKAVTEQILEPQQNKQWREKHGGTYYTLEVDANGTKFARITQHTLGGINGSAWAFVALADGQNKALGSYKRGDIFKPAGYSTPAKTARGNVFENLPLCKVETPYGPNYLR